MERQFEVIRFIKRQLVDGVYVPGDRLPNRWDLERELGASRATVQSAFDRLLLEGFVESRGRSGTFVAARPPYLNCFGLALMDSEQDWKTRGQFAQALKSEAADWSRTHETEFKVYEGIEPANEANESFVRLLGDARGHRLAGILMVTPQAEFMDAAMLSLPKIPIVTIQASEQSIYPCVPLMLIDRADFMSRAIETLAAQGRRRVGGLILATTLSPARFREQVLDPIRSKGMETRPYWWQFVSHSDAQSSRHAIELLMRLPRQDAPDALIIEDDSVVESATAGLVASGAQVPGGVAVVARANFPYPTQSQVPAVRIGLHISRILQDAIINLHLQRQGKRVPRQVRVSARSEDEWTRMKNSVLLGASPSPTKTIS